MNATRPSIRYLRYGVQLAFLLLTILIGYEFYGFVLHYESPGHPAVTRPPAVDAFLPIGGLMAFKYFLLTGIVDPVHPSGFILFVAIIGVSVVLRKGFCGWICPIGTVSQYAWMAGEMVFTRNFRIAGFSDIALRSLKYVLMALFLIAIGVMPMWSMAMFFIGDYYKTVDVRMMKFFTDMTTLTFWVLVVLVALSFLTKNFWCRYLCPYGALLGLLGRLSPFRIRRNEEKCIHCHSCTRHCPTHIDVEAAASVQTAECFGCMTCVSRCPSPGALDMTVSARKRVHVVKPWLFPLALVALFYLVIGIGMLTGNWHSKIPVEEFQQLIPALQKEYQQR